MHRDRSRRCYFSGLGSEMPLPQRDVKANEQLAWKLLSQFCCAAAIGTDYKKDPEFELILPTTWKALADDSYVRFSNIWHFRLTAKGWTKTLETNGTLCDSKMTQDLGQISRRLKDHLDRTQGPALVATHEIAGETGLPEYFVANVIHSHLISLCLKRKDADWAEGDGMDSLIEVPIDFGNRLDGH
jgi:hypothetical protein